MALPATESFTASNGTLVRNLTNWDGARSSGVSGGACTVQSNAAQASARTDVVYAAADWWTADTFSNDQYATATITAIASGIYIGVAVRLGGTDGSSNLTGYLFYGDSADGCYIDEYSGGSYIATLAGPGDPFSVNDVIRLEVEGTALRAYINGNLELSVTDASITSGRAGICAYDSGSSAIDNWEGGNYSATPPDRTVNVSDSITVSESITRLLTGHINKTETVTISESVNVLIDTGELTVNVSDSITVGETVTVIRESLDREVSVIDSITVDETIARLLIGHISVADSITVIDAELFGLETPAISVADAVTVTDSPALELLVAVSVADAVELAEQVALDLPVTLGVADEIEVSEAVNIAIAEAGTEQVVVGESVEITETVSLDLPVAVSVADSIMVADAPALTLVSYVSTADTVTVTDSPALLLIGHVSVADAVTVGEAVTLEPVSFAAVSETVEVSEAVNLLIAEPGTYTVSVNEDVAVTDQPALYLNVELAVAETITVTDQPTVAIVESGALEVSVSEAVTVTDSPALELPVAIAVTETVTVTEIISRQLLSFIVTGDSVTVTDQPVLDLTAPPELAVIVGDGVQVGEQIAMQLPEIFVSVADGVTVGEIVTAFVFTAVTFKEVTQRAMYRGMFKHMR